MKLIKRLFIKDYKNTNDKDVRFRYGTVASVFGIVMNLLLFGCKILAGIFSSSITIISDAINNLTDGGSSIISLIGFKLSGKPADKDHPFGHARYEYITGLIVSMLILAIGFVLCKESITKIISPEPVTVGVYVYIILSAGILGKLFLMCLNYNFAKAIDSDTLRATAIDSRNDIIATSAALVATIIMGVWGINVDAYFGLAVAVFILISGIKLFREIVSPLLGEPPQKEFVKKVKDRILSYENVLGLHELMLHSYGENNYYGSVHIEVSCELDPMVSHELADNIEKDVWDEFGLRFVVHTDPIQVNDKKVVDFRARVEKDIKEIDESLTIHDFRVVEGQKHTNLVFDVAVPFGVDVNHDKVMEFFDTRYDTKDMKYYFVVTIDRVVD